MSKQASVSSAFHETKRFRLKRAILRAKTGRETVLRRFWNAFVRRCETQMKRSFHIEPADVDRFIQAVSEGIVGAIIRLAERLYEWQRQRQAPYYVPLP